MVARRRPDDAHPGGALSGGQSNASADERHLARALGEHDRDAWRSFFDANYQRIYRYAYARLGNSADAEDATSATFLAAARNIRTFKHRGVPIEGWLFGIAHHETVNVQRKNRRNRTQPLDLAIGSADGTSAPDMRVDLLRALSTLRPDVRAVIALRWVEGRSIAEVASLIGKSEGAVKMMQGRAMRKLRSQLEELPASE